MRLLFDLAIFLVLRATLSTALQIQPRLIAETCRLLVIDKPPGVPFHRDAPSPSNDEALNFLDNFASSSPASPGVMELVRAAQLDGRLGTAYRGPLFPVHRLDRVTSGVLVLAKDRDAAGRVSRAFQRRAADSPRPYVHRTTPSRESDGVEAFEEGSPEAGEGGKGERRTSQALPSSPLVQKWYVALVDKKCKSAGCVRGDMAPSRRGAWKLLRTTIDPAITRFSLEGTLARPAFAAISSSSSSSSTPGASSSKGPAPRTLPARRVVLLRPETGRTHQLRVALKSLGTPIRGDTLYGGGGGGGDDDGNNDGDGALDGGADRCYLHAAALRLDARRLGLMGPGEEDDDFLFVCPPSVGRDWAGPEAAPFFGIWKATVMPKILGR